MLVWQNPSGWRLVEGTPRRLLLRHPSLDRRLLMTTEFVLVDDEAQHTHDGDVCRACFDLGADWGWRQAQMECRQCGQRFDILGPLHVCESVE
jgi:hypothetical protein